MLNKIILVVLSLIFFTMCILFNKQGGNNIKTTVAIEMTYDQMSTIMQENNQNKMNDSYILIVNGKELIDIKFNGDNFELPILLISQELGAKVEWVDSQRVVISSDDKSVVLDISEKDFGLAVPPGAIGTVRKLDGDDIILDDVSARGIITNLLNAKISYDCDEYEIFKEDR